MKIIKRHIILITIILICIPAFTQNKTFTNDTLKGNFFNALDYSLQKRYIPKGEAFKNNRFTDNLYITLNTGFESLVKRGNTGYGFGPNFGVMVGKYINPYHNFRISFNSGWYTRDAKDIDLKTWGIYASHLFNISAYTKGYNPKRVFDISTIVGFGYVNSNLDKEKKNAGNIHGGLQLKIHPSSRLDILLEPHINFYTDNIDHSSKRNWHRYDVGYAGIIGLNYRFTAAGKNQDSQHLFEENNLFANTFLRLNAGVQFPLSGDILKEIGFASSTGTHFSISAGKWIIPLLGFQVSMFSSFNKWGENETKNNYLTSYKGGRVEGILNILSFFNYYTPESRLELIASMGAEFGSVYKETEIGHPNIDQRYTGLTTSLQLKYYFQNNLGVFFEPRFSNVPYPVYYEREGVEVPVRQNHNDQLFSFNIGLEIRRATSKQREESRIIRKQFTPSFFANVKGGINMLITQEQFNKNVDYQYGVLIGRQFTSLSAFRTGLDYSTYSTKNQKESTHAFTVPIDYLFNLTNFLLGYGQERLVNLDFIAGIIVTHAKDTKGAYTGGETGFHLSFGKVKGVSFYLESLLRIHSKNFIQQRGFNKPTHIPSWEIGVSYRL